MANTDLNFAPPPVRTPFFDAGPAQSESGTRFEDRGKPKPLPRQPHRGWMQWFQSVTNKLTAPIAVGTPTAKTPGQIGQQMHDANFLYTFTVANTWMKTPFQPLS
jgi:hypothetical protein